MRVVDEMAVAAGAFRQLEHFTFKETHQGPGPCQAEHRFGAVQSNLLQIKAVGLHEAFHAAATVLAGQLPVETVKQGGVNVRQPGDEPVGGKRQHPLRRRHAAHFLVKPDQPATAEFGFRFQHLQPGPQLNQFDRQLHLVHFADQTLLGHWIPPPISSRRTPSTTPRGFAPAPAPACYWSAW